jgi:NAD(P)-dependent dehydrogenase (short-subunit alcohol dehydrogenase family)
MATFLQGGTATLARIMAVNFFAPAALCHAALPGMVERGWGRLIAISSLASSIGEAHGPGYCASKAALDGLFRNLAIDYSPAGLTVNTIEPGALATERLSRHGAVKARRYALAAAVRRVGLPEDVAHAVTFLASPQAGFVTGESLRVDGGLHLGNPMAAMYVRPGRQDREQDRDHDPA